MSSRCGEWKLIGSPTVHITINQIHHNNKYSMTSKPVKLEQISIPEYYIVAYLIYIGTYIA